MDDAELESLSWALVFVAVTDKWDHVRDVVARIFAGGGVERRGIERRLDATWNRLTEAPGDQGPGELLDLSFVTRHREAGDWRTRFADLLDDHPESADDLRALLDEIRPAPAGGGSGGVLDEDQPQEDFDLPPKFLYPSELAEVPDIGGYFAREPESYDPVSRAIKAAVKPGLLAFNAPDEMTQGHKEKVEVAIANSTELRDALIASLQGPVEIEEIRASQFMEVELRGDTFKIAPISEPNQIVEPIALWQYDVWPLRPGVHTLTLSVSLSLENMVPGAPPGSRISVPAVERQIRIRVNLGYSTRSFLGSNWQWFVATGIGAGGTAAAFLTVRH